MAARICEEAHCHSEEVTEVCKEVYGEDDYANKPVASRDSQGACKCICSCMALDTPVAVDQNNNRPIQDFKPRTAEGPGDMVMAASANLQWIQKEVMFSSGTNRGSKQPNAILIEYGNEFIVTTGDHLFLLPNGKLRMANRLSSGDNLVRADGSTVQISSVRRGDYYSGFHHIATSKGNPNGSLDGHLILTSGVVSADYTVQLFGEQFLDPAEKTLPEVGSPEYEAKYGTPSSLIPIQSVAAGKAHVGQPGFTPPIRSIGQIFVPAENTYTVIPPHATSFISDTEAQAKAKDAKRSLDDTTSLDEANGIVFHTSAYPPYEDVVYHVDWYDNTVNAFAWVDNGVRHVALKGGLLRHHAIHFQAVALILAHELGHHFGGQPTFPSGLSCEGQADYYGANIVMRKVWFGDFYLQLMEPAVQQLQDFFGPNPGNHGCDHPSRECRTSIYNAAIELRPIPTCAFAT